MDISSHHLAHYYESREFDPQRLRRFARAAAKGRAATPSSTFDVIRDVTRTERRLFGSRQVTEPVAKTVDSPGWFLVLDIREGWKAVKKPSDLHHGGHDGLEEGHILILSRDGDLLKASYRIMLHNIYGLNYSTKNWYKVDHFEAPVPCSDHDILAFDAINRNRYRDVRPKRDEWRRDELRPGFKVKYPHPGMEASLAIKRFKESGEYVKRLEIQA